MKTMNIIIPSTQSMATPPNISDLLLAPRNFFCQLRTRPIWLQAFLLASILSIGLLLLLNPISHHLMNLQLMGQISDERLYNFESNLRLTQFINILAAPFFLLLKLSIQAYIIWGLLLVLGGDAPFRSIFTMMAHLTLLNMLDTVLGVSLNYVTGIGIISHPEQIRMTLLSVSAFVNISGHPLIKLLLDAFSLGAIWYAYLMTIGLRELAELSYKRAGIVTLFFWVAQYGSTLGLSLAFASR